MYLGVKATTGEFIVGDQRGSRLTRTVRRKLERDRWNRDSLSMVIGVSCRKNNDDPKVDGESLKGGVVVMDRDYKENQKKKNTFQSQREVLHITREDLGLSGFTAKCPGRVSIPRGSVTQAHTIRIAGRGSRSTVRMGRRGRSQLQKEENTTKQQRQNGWTKTERAEPSSSGSAGTGVNHRRRKSEAEHPDDIEREHEKPLAAEETKRKAEDDEEDEEARRRKTGRFPRKPEREEKQNTPSEIA